MKKNQTCSPILVIGAGAVGSTFIKKANLLPSIFPSIHLASRSVDKCIALSKQCTSIHIVPHQLDADNSNDVLRIIEKSKASLVVNLALPYQDLTIMDACIRAKVNYLDTANYEPKDEAKFCYEWQWDLHQSFVKNNILALLGCGFDPGVTNIFCKYAEKHLFDVIDTIDILDCNGGDHGHPFATNFNPEINIREITQNGKYYSNNKWTETKPMEISQVFDFPEIGKRNAYLMYHEELQSLVKNINGLKEIRFWMTFSDEYLNHLKVLQNVGLTSIKPISFKGKSIVPLEFLKTCLPDPSSLSENYSGKTCIGCLISGTKNGIKKKVFIYNTCSHEESHKELSSQAVSYTTAIPALIGSALIARGVWSGTGTLNVEEMDPDPFMEELPIMGLPWKIKNY
ncbi:saccharopine dehydrogenase family protein [bacterium]|jgi:saccharopine dehydrogenase (NAD+, L-lysine forming)|nr:saccharopine dehydrogenase family protein [bacterium]